MGNGIQDLHILCIRLKLPLVVTLVCVGNMIWNNRRNGDADHHFDVGNMLN